MPEWSQNIADVRPRFSVSACPGLFRIAPARDGGICRVKLPLGQLAADQARVLAGASVRFGNGIIEATNRANLQIRGITAAGETSLVASLLDAGLGPTQMGADDVRNVMVSPAAGIDPSQHIDALPLARDLLAHLQNNAAYAALSPKFCVLVDGGESVAIVDHPHDIWLASMGRGAKMALGFAGTPPTQADDRMPFLAVRPQHAIATVAAALSLFIEEAAKDESIRRFRQLFEWITREAFLARLAEKLGTVVQRTDATAWHRRQPAARGHVGVRDQCQSGLVFIGAVPPVGRLSPHAMIQLADISAEFGDGTLRFTPWQSVIVPSVQSGMATDVKHRLEAIGLVCNSDHPMVSVVACAGMTGCAAAMSDTKADALAIAQALDTGGAKLGLVHLSGCAKSCASVRVADVTLVGSAPGTYELFRKSGGGGKFGQSVAPKVDVREAGRRIREMATEGRG
jgi:precorrin-3B synthase